MVALAGACVASAGCLGGGDDDGLGAAACPSEPTGAVPDASSLDTPPGQEAQTGDTLVLDAHDGARIAVKLVAFDPVARSYDETFRAKAPDRLMAARISIRNIGERPYRNAPNAQLVDATGRRLPAAWMDSEAPSPGRHYVVADGVLVEPACPPLESGYRTQGWMAFSVPPGMRPAAFELATGGGIGARFRIAPSAVIGRAPDGGRWQLLPSGNPPAS